jgi:hypothetical protein
VNVEGTLNAVRAAAAAGARRFVYASSVAAYGLHGDNPVGMTEDWPVRPAARLFDAQEKAELERLLIEEAAGLPGLDVYLLRPSIVLGPHTVGGKELLPGPLAPLVGRLAGGVRKLPVALPAPVPQLPVQFVHEDDVGQALLLCIVGAGPTGADNIAGDGVLSATDVVRELGLRAVAVPAQLVRGPARAMAALGGPAPDTLPGGGGPVGRRALRTCSARSWRPTPRPPPEPKGPIRGIDGHRPAPYFGTGPTRASRPRWSHGETPSTAIRKPGRRPLGPRGDVVDAHRAITRRRRRAVRRPHRGGRPQAPGHTPVHRDAHGHDAPPHPHRPRAADGHP